MKLLSAGQRVLDLGAAPGSWSLYASQRVGPGGQVLAVDLQEISQVFPPNVRLLQADALGVERQALETFAPYDVVLSDMAPNTSGNKVRDQAQSFELFMRALEVAALLGKDDGSFVGKIFMSGDFQAARKATGELYGRVQVIRPDSTRSQSSEVFMVGVGLKRRPPP